MIKPLHTSSSKRTAFNLISSLHTQIQAQLNRNGQFYNLCEIYPHSAITYSVISPTFNVSIDRRLHEIDYKAMANEALDEWKEQINLAHPARSISFVEISNHNMANISFNASSFFSPSPEDLAHTILYFMAGQGPKKAFIQIYKNALDSMVFQTRSDLINKGILPNSISKLEYFKLLLKVTLKHEIGHAFTLEHPSHTVSRVDINSGTTILVANSIIIPGSRSEPRPPSIMEASAPSYLTNLSHYLGGNITTDNVAVTREDGLAVAALFSPNPPRVISENLVSFQSHCI